MVARKQREIGAVKKDDISSRHIPSDTVLPTSSQFLTAYITVKSSMNKFIMIIASLLSSHYLKVPLLNT